MAKAENEEIVQEQAAKKKVPIVKIIIISLVVLIAIAAGVFGGIYFFTDHGDAKKAAVQPPKPLIGTMWPMAPFIVNLSDNQGERYLKIVIEIEVSDQSVVPELELLKPKLRDNMLDLLTAKSFNELMDVGGKQRLRDEIVMRLNSFLVKGKIVQVYFTEFVIQ
ncbi:MAG TPA: flagellar basal body-associated FliL family protein [Syntrophales bacterium]|nr:flagellar basal body-associated FliL family protein [Syntrophales bacterium]